jgi:hypothetical protein
MTAVWTPPRTWAVGELATAAMLNTHVRDNLDWLKTPPQAVTTLAATQSITSTAFVDVASLNLTTAGGALQVSLLVNVGFSGAGQYGQLALAVDGVQQAGVLMQGCLLAGALHTIGFDWYIAAKPAGAHTITLRALVSAGGTFILYGTNYGTIAQLWAKEI